MTLLSFIIALGGAAVVVAGFLRWVLPRLKTAVQTVVAFKDAILGRDAVLHPDTKTVLVPEQPGLGARVASIEVAVIELARTHRRIDEVVERVSVLEKGVGERGLARTESIEMLRVIDTALRTEPEDH